MRFVDCEEVKIDAAMGENDSTHEFETVVASEVVVAELNASTEMAHGVCEKFELLTSVVA